MIELIIALYSFLCPYILAFVTGSIITTAWFLNWKIGYRERIKSQALRNHLNPGLKIAYYVKRIDKLINAGLSDAEKIAVPMLLNTLVARLNLK